MGVDSNIGWTDNTWNIAVGCTKVSTGCKFCYMMRDMGPKLAPKEMDVNGNVYRTTDATFFKPLTWQAKALKSRSGQRLKVFTCSLTDFFHPSIDEYRAEAWEVIRSCPDLIFQILTKRPERIADNLPPDWGSGWENVWMGVSVENQETAELRIPKLCETPALLKFISLEPLLGPIDLSGIHYGSYFEPNSPGMNKIAMGSAPVLGAIDWAIIGGESGHNKGEWKYRPCHMVWIDSLISQLKAFYTPIFVKQLGTHLATALNIKHRHGSNQGDAGFPGQFKLSQYPYSYKDHID